MKTFTIENPAMCGEAYVSAITNVAEAVNKALHTNYTFRDDWIALEKIAESLGILFDENGEIVKPSRKINIEIGDVISINHGLTLKVKDARGTWVKLDYLDRDGKWKPRGRTENRASIEALLREGKATIS